MSVSAILIKTLKGAGSKIAEKLAQLNIFTVQDLLFHLPSRYEDRSQIYPISAIRSGDRVLIEGVVRSMRIVGARRYLRCDIVDASGKNIELVFYYFAKSHEKKLSQLSGCVRCFGEVRYGFSGHLEMVHPEYAAVQAITEKSVLTLSPGLSPIYPTTKGLHQTVLRKLMTQALQLLQHNHFLPELIPVDVLNQFHFMELKKALHVIHFPSAQENAAELLSGKHPAQQRLVFEELLAHQLSLQSLRQGFRNQSALLLPCDHTLTDLFISTLPFQLTAAQQRVMCEIQTDLSKSIPMMRLVQGDVGSGKTVVACIAALQAIAQGAQVAVMAPTEILCEQHFKNFSQWLAPLNISIDLLLGRHTTTEKNAIKKRLLSGETKLIIGTHALFEEAVAFQQLALLIIDEQHRFGVHQRLALVEKGRRENYFPHQLIMTATPIPRTLMMTAYADLDCSVIDELPPGRKPITTTLIASDRRDEVIARVGANCDQQKQVFWICTLIEESEESEALQCQAAETTAKQLQQSLPTLNIGLIHGRLKSDEKNAVMAQFLSRKIDLLVATTVVEVGVDVPNASVMIIENPERLGLAQLHQLRGRIGRGDRASFCVLLYQNPLSDIAKKRLSVMRESQDGFLIAETDLHLRGAGDVLGVRQSGVMQLRVADLMRDHVLLPMVQKVSQQLMQDHTYVVDTLTQRWIGSRIHYLNA
ncbi:MAG: ATP-dependent DNA helicase RecG [Gammaproteobacteria bacterium RIFCSPHIGHO2_02_FULL_39_13]|nr:MAG: ATP-dependent DNA helicase RecG [Gammaproteobacteria bacterium RIFCSPHIGHO2_02_FULL_39_13]OGT48670.1 MAG: ATP-dependent DNA helicase RecG [Gammaproteobacteria bacterium RIFCSPHIGHO2_12_FULL_39_24]